MLFHKKASALVWNLRCRYYSMLFSARGLRINGRVKFICPENLHLGQSVSINDGCIINAGGRIYIGDRSRVSPGVIINSGVLQVKEVAPDSRFHEYSEVVIEQDVWLASGVIINPGVRIGAGAVVAAGAVVTQDIPAKSIAMGIPARVIKRL